MNASFGGKKLIDPRAAAAICLRHELPSSVFLGLANSYTCPAGAEAGRAWLLMTRADLNALPADQYLALTFGEGERAVFPRLAFLQARCVIPAGLGDGGGVYLAEAADRRFDLGRVPAPRAYNCHTYFGDPSFNASTLNGGEPWAWGEAAGDLWAALDAVTDAGGMGAFPGLPYEPAGRPEGLAYWGWNAMDALCHLLGLVNCGLRYDPIRDTFSVFRVGAEDPDFDAAVAKYKRSVREDEDGLFGDILPETVRVSFPRLTPPADGPPFYDVDVPCTGAVAGTVATVPGGMYAEGDGDNPANEDELLARAAEVAENWQSARESAAARMRTVWPGVAPAAGVMPGPQVQTVRWGDRGTGMVTEIARREAPGRPSAGGPAALIQSPASGTLEVKAAAGAPDYTGVTVIAFDQADGFTLSQPGGAGTARIDLAAASMTQTGVVTTGSQTFGSDRGVVKSFNCSLAFGGNYDGSGLARTAYFEVSCQTFFQGSLTLWNPAGSWSALPDYEPLDLIRDWDYKSCGLYIRGGSNNVNSWSNYSGYLAGNYTTDGATGTNHVTICAFSGILDGPQVFIRLYGTDQQTPAVAPSYGGLMLDAKTGPATHSNVGADNIAYGINKDGVPTWGKSVTTGGLEFRGGLFLGGTFNGVTSVGLSLPGIFTVTAGPITSSGSLTAVLASQSANLVFAGPSSGGAAAPTFRALTAADLPAGTGSVTSVGLSLPAIFTVTVTPVTSSGTLTAVLANQSANLVFAGPASGGAAAPTFRALTAEDLPAQAGGWVTIPVSFANFATGSTTHVFIPSTLAAKTVVHAVVVRTTTAFSGGGIGAYTVDVGLALGSGTEWCSGYDVMAAPSGTNFSFHPGSAATGVLPSLLNPTTGVNISITANCVGANLNAATQGIVEVSLFLSRLP